MANTILKWGDANDGITGFKIRKGSGPIPDPLLHPVVATVGPTVREYIAPVGKAQEFWAVSVTDGTQDVVTGDQALCYPGPIVPPEAIEGVLQGIAFAAGYGPFVPDALEAYKVTGPDGNHLSAGVLITDINGVTYSLTSSNIYKWGSSGQELTVALDAALPSQSGTIRWAVALPSGLIAYACSGKGIMTYDPKTKAFVNVMPLSAYVPGRGVYSHVLKKIIVAGGIEPLGTDHLTIGFIDVSTWTLSRLSASSVPGGDGVSEGTLVVFGTKAYYWPNGSTGRMAVASWNMTGGDLIVSSVVAPAYPSTVYRSQGVPSSSEEAIMIGGGKVYTIGETGVTTQTLAEFLGGSAPEFNDSCAAVVRTPDGGYLAVGSAGAKVLYFDHNYKNAKVMTNGTTGGMQYALLVDGTIHCMGQGSSPYTRLTWVDGKKPNIIWPGSWKASQYNCQGRAP